jgi:hypothetical protein
VWGISFSNPLRLLDRALARDNAGHSRKKTPGKVQEKEKERFIAVP